MQVMIANSSNETPRRLKYLLALVIGGLLSSAIAVPGAAAQTAQPQATPAPQTAGAQTTQPQATPAPQATTQTPAAAAPAAQPQTAVVLAAPVQGNTRKRKLGATPEYPELARKMHIQGVARVMLTIAPDGKVGAVKELGGNPILVASLVQAVKKWKYETADHESQIEIKFEFIQGY